MADRLARAVAADRTVRGLAVVSTALVDDARHRHGTLPTATAALGRALTAALLLAATLKRDERLSLEFVGDGPLGGILVDATADGRTRGFVRRPQTHLPPKRGKLDVGGALGRGSLCVMRVPLDGQQIYRSIVPLTTGEIGDDVAHYLVRSAQIPSVVGLGVFVEPDGTAVAAGGYLLQTMPGATDETARALEARVRESPSPSELVREHGDAGRMLDALLAPLGPEAIGGHDVRFQCRCDPDRARRAVVAMGRDEIERALLEDGGIEAVCEFCNAAYRLDPDAVRALLS